MKNKYDWNEIQDFYNMGNSIRECCKQFGVVWASIQKAIRRNEFTITRNKSEACKNSYKKGVRKAHYPTLEEKEKLRKRAIKNELGGKRNSIKFNYNGIILDSSYEVRFAKLLDYANIKWNRPKKILWVDDVGVQHRYYPDFFIEEFNCYIDTKNDYLAEKDKRKIELVSKQNNIVVKIVTLKNIKELEKFMGV
jgi:hypothetical protein